MNIQSGSEVVMQSGCTILVDGLIKEDHELGVLIFKAYDNGTQKQYVLKAFPDEPKTRKRIRKLIDADWTAQSELLCAPEDWFEQGNIVGHIARWAPGRPLEEFLSDDVISFQFYEAVSIALALTHAVNLLHEAGWAHGDLSSQNIYLEHKGRNIAISLIDFDNFVAPKAPPPPKIATELYMAPELLPNGANTSRIPTIESDIYSLTVSLHELLLLKHPVSGYDNSREELYKAVEQGTWLHDPQKKNTTAPNIGGASVKNFEPRTRQTFPIWPEGKP